MLVCSTLNPSCISSTHLFVVHYDDERILVPVDPYPKYSDLHAFITKEWALESQTFYIETDELNVCAGRRVRIHEEAWIGVKDIVGNIFVRVRSPLPPSDLTQRHKHAPLMASIKNEMSHDEVLTSRAQSESADEAEVEEQTKAEIHKDEYEDETPTARARRDDSDTKVHSGSPRKQQPQGDTLNLFSDEADTGGTAENQQQTDEQESQPPTQKQTWKSFLGSLHRSNSSNPPNSASTASTLVTPSTSTGMRNAYTAKAKGEKDSGQPSSDNSTSGDPERVLIIVDPPTDSIYEARGFRIRREHTVRTVLKGACKAFKIDYTTTRLRMVTEQDESGDLVSVKCDDTDTMLSLGVEDNQRFIIEMAGEEEEEEGESN